MSTLGNPRQVFLLHSRNEEEPLGAAARLNKGLPKSRGLELFAAEPPRGVSEHNARKGEQVLKKPSATSLDRLDLSRLLFI